MHETRAMGTVRTDVEKNMTEERKNNGCTILFDSLFEVYFDCAHMLRCDFIKTENGLKVCDYLECGFCANTEAQNDALNRAAAAINEEQARRANQKVEPPSQIK